MHPGTFAAAMMIGKYRLMTKSPSSSVDLDSSSEPAAAPRPLRKRRPARSDLAKQLKMAPANGAEPAPTLDLSTSMKPLLIGVGIGAALVGTAMAVRSRGARDGGVSPFHGPNAALAGALTKTALLAVARAMSGEAIRTVATRALLEVAEAWKA